MLFAYGDHWPPLDPGLDAYSERMTPAGDRVGAGSRADETVRISPTPLLMWSNTDATLPRGYRGGFNFLGPAILRAAGLAPRCQFALLEPLHARVDLVHPRLMTADVDPTLLSEIDRYWSLTYRLLIDGPGATHP